MQRVKLTIEYDGTKFLGWQKQNSHPSIQESIEIVLAILFQQEIKLFVAGRTDAGVHARGQVAHFDFIKNKSKNQYSESRIVNGLNALLRPSQIAILNAEFVDDNFHSRFSAKQKSYIYRVINRVHPLTIDNFHAWQVCRTIDIQKLIEASKFLIGNHDFSSFRGPDCQSQTTLRTINQINILTLDNEINIEFIAKSFLHNQIRIMVGTLKKISTIKHLEPNSMINILNKKNREAAGETAPARGLYLNKIDY